MLIVATNYFGTPYKDMVRKRHDHLFFMVPQNGNEPKCDPETVLTDDNRVFGTIQDVCLAVRLKFYYNFMVWFFPITFCLVCLYRHKTNNIMSAKFVCASRTNPWS